jgi:transcriptional regulator with PAS, ATPase and Fis domain
LLIPGLVVFKVEAKTGLVVMCRMSDVKLHDKNFSLYSAVQSLEAKLIRQALEEAGGSVTRAAKLLGLKHQTLIAMLGMRHNGLHEKQTPPEKRLQSIIKDSPEE